MARNAGAGSLRPYQEPTWDPGHRSPRPPSSTLPATCGITRPAPAPLAALPSVRPASYGAIIVDAADTHGRYFGCKNGVVDLADARLLPAAEGRQHAVTKSTGIDYVKDAQHDYIPRLFENMEEDAAEYLIAVLGRAMWGQPDDVSLVLLGETRAGKSTLLKALWAALGPDYYGTAPADVFDRSARFRSTHNEERRGFYGPRIVAIIEGGGRAVDTQLFNASTGQDTQAYREIREKSVSRTPTATMVWCANTMPKLDMADPAVRERTRIVDYAPIPKEKRDPAIRDTFASRDADASQAVLALLVRAASENPHGRPIPLPASIQAPSTAPWTWLPTTLTASSTMPSPMTAWASWRYRMCGSAGRCGATATGCYATARSTRATWWAGCTGTTLSQELSPPLFAPWVANRPREGYKTRRRGEKRLEIFALSGPAIHRRDGTRSTFRYK